MRIVPYGREATIIDGLSPGTAALLTVEVRAVCNNAGVAAHDVIPAARSLVVKHDATHSRTVQQLFVELLSSRDIGSHKHLNPASVVEIPVRYDGADLAEVARACDESVERIVRLHSDAVYTVEFCGFAPGFAYLRGLHEQLHLPRRASPRARVPAGSVAIATNYSAVYPNDSPGGWHLLGTTSLRIWNTDWNPPALLQPGATVRFVPVS